MLKYSSEKVCRFQFNGELIKIQPGDRVVIPKSEFKLIEHHAIFLGNGVCGNDLFAENIAGKGVKFTTATDFLGNSNQVTRIEKFEGTQKERIEALERAVSLKGRQYNLFNFNCEHYSNIVQKNISSSDQVNIFTWLCIVFFLLIVAMNKNRNYRYVKN